MDVKVGPVLTYLSCAACVMIFFKAAGMTEPHTWESLSSIGYFPAVSIWEGNYWGLWTTVFAQVSFWHLAFNLYWLWLLGSAIEMNAGRILWIRQCLKAVEWYTAIREAEPGNAWALCNRGVLFGELGMDAEANRDIGFAVHLDPNLGFSFQPDPNLEPADE